MCAVASEEREDLVQLDPNGQYVIMIDPLDGSSNIDVGVSIGTIFSICKRVSPNGPATTEDALQPGSEQIALQAMCFMEPAQCWSSLVEWR